MAARLARRGGMLNGRYWGIVRWSTLNTKWVKLNVDGVVYEGAATCATGVIRDYVGKSSSWRFISSISGALGYLERTCSDMAKGLQKNLT